MVFFDTNLETSLRLFANNKGLTNHILWLGARKDPEKLMAACDITTLTSDNGEGFPNVVAESMACGVPCITTDIGDASHIVHNFFEVVPPQNPQTLAAAWESALDENNDQQKAKSIQIRRSIVARFSSKAVAKKNLDILLD